MAPKLKRGIYGKCRISLTKIFSQFNHSFRGCVLKYQAYQFLKFYIISKDIARRQKESIFKHQNMQGHKIGK